MALELVQYSWHLSAYFDLTKEENSGSSINSAQPSRRLSRTGSRLQAATHRLAEKNKWLASIYVSLGPIGRQNKRCAPDVTDSSVWAKK